MHINILICVMLYQPVMCGHTIGKFKIFGPTGLGVLVTKEIIKILKNLELNYLFVGLVASLYKRGTRPKRLHLHLQSRGRFFRSIGCPSMECSPYFQILRYLHMQYTKQEDTSDKQPCL